MWKILRRRCWSWGRVKPDERAKGVGERIEFWGFGGVGVGRSWVLMIFLRGFAMI